MFEIISNNYVYKISVNKRELYGNVIRKRMPNKTGDVNELIVIPITYEKFILDHYETDTTINKSASVYLDESLVGQIIITNGIGNIEFESAEVGTYTITVDGYSAEVTVV